MPTDNTTSLDLAKTIAELAIDKKAERVISIDLKGLFTIKGILDFIKKFKNAINNLS